MGRPWTNSVHMDILGHGVCVYAMYIDRLGTAINDGGIGGGKGRHHHHTYIHTGITTHTHMHNNAYIHS